MTYRVTFTRGNGYYCDCCRQECLDEKHFTNYDDAVDFIHDIIAQSRSKDFFEFPEDSDVSYDNIEIVQDEINIVIDQNKINQKIEKFKSDYLKRKAEEEQKTKARERAEFERLKKKLGEN